MSKLVCHGSEFTCPKCQDKLKLSVSSSSTDGEKKKIGTQTNCSLSAPSAPCTLIASAPVPCPGVPNSFLASTGQSTDEIDGQAALGDGAIFQCPKGPRVKLSKAVQNTGEHDTGSASVEAPKGAGGIASIKSNRGKKGEKKESGGSKEKKDPDQQSLGKEQEQSPSQLTYIVNPAHDTNCADYDPRKSVLPENHEKLWKASKPFGDKYRWTKVGNGKKAVYHRFARDPNGMHHWNGSTNGVTKSGKPRSIEENNIPNKVKKWKGIPQL